GWRLGCAFACAAPRAPGSTSSAGAAGSRSGSSVSRCAKPAHEPRAISLPRPRGRVRVGAGMSLLTVREISKRFGGVNALAGVTFTVEPGQVLGVIGPNGAGKTTLLNCISGLTRPDAGDIRWEEASIRGMPPYRIARLGIGRTFQIFRPF